MGPVRSNEIGPTGDLSQSWNPVNTESRALPTEPKVIDPYKENDM